MKEIMVGGTRYPSLNEFCKKYGLKYGWVRRLMLEKGLTPEEILSQEYQKSSSGKPIFCSGIRYASVSQFCRDNGLRYPTVVAQLNRGMAPEQILEQQHTSMNTFSAQKSECEYEGQHFLSLSKAAEHFGIQPSYLYALKKKEHLSANETLRLAMERKPAKYPSGTVVPCTIDGVEFFSQTEALAFYRIPRATVTSRMQRSHLTFEEALMGMIQKQRRLTPMVSLFDSANIPQTTCAPVQGLLDQKLRDCHYEPEYFREKDQVVLHIQETLRPASKPKDIYLIFADRNVEIILPELYRVSKETLRFYQNINQHNRTYQGAKLWYNDEAKIISANWNCPWKGTNTDAAVIMKMLFTFLGNCEVFLKKLI